MERYPCSWIGRINIIKMSVLPKVIYRFKGIPIIIPMTLFHRNRKNNLKIHIKSHKTWNSQSKLEINNGGDTTFPNFKLYNRASVIRATLFCLKWHKNRFRRREQKWEPKDKLVLIWWTNIWQESQEHLVGNDSAFKKYCWVNWISLHKIVKMNVYLYYTAWKKLTHSRLKTNARLKTIELFEKDRRKTLWHWFYNDFFFYMMPKVQARKAKIKETMWN